MLINLSSYIQADFLKKELEKSCVIISNIEEADQYVVNIMKGDLKNVIFEKSSLKSYCFEKLEQFDRLNIVNCNTSINRFDKNDIDKGKLNIFDNIHNCKDINVLNIIKEKKGIKGILVC